MQNKNSGNSLWEKEADHQLPSHQQQRGIKTYMQRRVAIHEMCHAYCAHILGVPFDFVTIVPKDDMLGNVQLSRRASIFNPAQLTPAQANDWACKHCIIGFAGNAGILNLTGENDWDGAREDLQVIKSILTLVALSDADYQARMDAYWREARMIVNRDWAIIYAITESLIRAKTMTGAQVGQKVDQLKAQRR